MTLQPGTEMRILHTSDLHTSGKAYRRILRFEEDFDLWLDTGDLFPNKGRGCVGRIDKVRELRHQASWAYHKAFGKRLAEWLAGRPVVYVGGNHDFISLGSLLRRAGHKEVYEATPEGVDVLGHRFAGFRHVPWLGGEWVGEIPQAEFRPLVDRVLASGSDILTTHAPPAGILDRDSAEVGGYGITSLVSSLAYREHSFTHHFFGHAHNSGGTIVDEVGIRFINGACNKLVHTL